jgi:hypothetical protein
MKLFGKLLAVIAGTVLFRATTTFFERYDVLVFDKEDVQEAREQATEESEQYNGAIDFRGTPSHICICGSDVWNLKVVFQDHEIATYFLDMQCANCGSLATAPTPIDKEM